MKEVKMGMIPFKISDREKKLFLVAGAVVLFYVFFQFFLGPKWGEISELKVKARQSRLDLMVATAKIRVLDALEGKEKMFVKVSESREEKALQVLRELSGATSKSRLNLISIKPLAENGEGLKFSLTCFGSYQNLYDFLRILDRADMAVHIDSLDISGGGSRQPNLKIVIFLTAYY